MGGTFDPIHHGHLVAAEGARHEFQLDEVVFVPALVSPHKTDRQAAAPYHRMTMTLLATLSNPFFSVSDVDLRRPGPSYTVDTLRFLREERGKEAEFFFITGADAILEILRWKDPQVLLAMATFVAAARPGYPRERLEELLLRLPAESRSRIIYLEIPALAISSSDLRERVRLGRPIKYLVPESVEFYVRKEGLYRLSSS
jgi:nicotinate-nucleotide adenylyltransferase